MSTRTSITRSHFEHLLWVNELEFYRDEIGIFERHLEEILQKNTKEEVIDKCMELRNQLARQRNVIDQLEYDIRLAEKELAIYLNVNETIDPESVNVEDQDIMRHEIDSFKRTYQDMKDQFMLFETEWM